MNGDDIDSGFQQMSRKTVAQCVNPDASRHAAPLVCQIPRILRCTDRDMLARISPRNAAPPLHR